MFAIRAATEADLPAVRSMLREYVAWIGLDLSFQGFEEELRGLPGAYVPPQGALLVADAGADTVAMIALRPLEVRLKADTTLPDTTNVCEMKRLFVRPSARGLGLGRAMVARVLDEARAIGYREMRLDTLPMMGDAQAMYEGFGFRDIEPYYDSPVTGARFMAVIL